MNRLVALSLGILSAYIASAASVVVRQRMVVDGVATELSEEVMVVGTEHSTMAPKTINGYIFTHWTISTKQVFAARDEWGRAYDRPTFKVAEKSTLTAWYVSATEDSDGDGVADGHEMYWYGNLEQNGASDTDGDGFSFALELANGTNPHMMETEVTGPIIGALGEEVVYNAAGYKHVVVRSEPEGTLLATSEDWVRPGATITTAGYSPSNSKFVYWTMNGVPQRDGFGRALDSVSFIMDDEDVELVAATVEDAEMRQKLYWYGDVAVAMTSDTDGDGSSFAQEIANGTNPLMAETEVEGPITYALGEEVVVHSADCRRVVIRSAPDDAMTASSEEWVRTGATITTPSYSPNNSKFVYWTINGVVQRDAFGRALDQVSITVGNEDVELVAATVDDDEMRMKLYWYGDVSVSMMSDTDGDGFTFAQEIANGTNPLMAESEVEGPITVATGAQVIYDPLGSMTECTATVTGYSGEYDGLGHGIAVKVAVPDYGYTIRYSLEEFGEYSSVAPTITNAGLNQRIYYRIDPEDTDEYLVGYGFGEVSLTPKPMSGDVLVVLDQNRYCHDGQEKRPMVVVRDTTRVAELIEGVDYALIYENNVEVGLAKVKVIGKANYTGSIERQFEIVPRSWVQVNEALGNVGLITYNEGVWHVTLTNNPSGPLVIPGDIGNMVLDLRGCNVLGEKGGGGSESAPGKDGGPAIRIVGVENGEPTPTHLELIDSIPDDADDVVGGAGGGGNPGGNGGAGVFVDAAAVEGGAKVVIGASVGVCGGNAGNGIGSGCNGVNGPGVVGVFEVKDGGVVVVPLPRIAAKEYAGELQKADIVSTDFYEVSYNEGGISCGKYPVVLQLKDTVGCRWATNSVSKIVGSLAYLDFVIEKVTIDVSNCRWNYAGPLTYNAEEQIVMVTNLPNGVSAEYVGNKATDAGSYTAHVILNYNTDNYVVDAVPDLTWTIAKATIDVSNCRWNYDGPLTYTSREQWVELIGLPIGVTASYRGNRATESGDYTAHAMLNYDTVNYMATTIPDLNWSIIGLERRVLWHEDDVFGAAAATQWDGHVVDEAEAIVGVVSVTVGTPNRLTGLSRITAKVRLADGKRRVQIFKGYMNSGTFVSDDCRFGLELGKNAMNGFIDDYLIYGARNQFKAKDIESRNFALAAGKRCAGAYTLVVEQDGGFSTFMITVKSQGWVGIRGTLADGTTISGSSRLLLGECECLIPLSLSRNGKSLSGLIWFGEDGTIECTNFHGDVDSIVLVGDSQEGFMLKSNSLFKIDVGQLGEMIGPGLLEELVPNGMPISMTGTKFILPRTGRVVIDKSTGGVDESKLGDNPAGLRLACSAKTGLVTGRFNVYQLVNGKVKSIPVVIRGVMLNGEVYCMGKISGTKSLPIVIER